MLLPIKGEAAMEVEHKVILPGLPLKIWTQAVKLLLGEVQRPRRPLKLLRGIGGPQGYLKVPVIVVIVAVPAGAAQL